MDANEFSEKLMRLSMELQTWPISKQKAFTELLYAAKKAYELGMTSEEIQLIVVSAVQISANPEIKQLFSILTGEIDIDPKDEYQ
tara:strand:+ start:558 stop:812 length:255 start_codon:yes stop_codon:yes gene_type:complete